MPIDRELTLKRAEKLLRQGRLELAIAEYGQVVGEFPRDWATANLLGDLYVRAGQIDAASQQYARIAEHLAGEGFTAKAAALYKKVIKLNPSDEAALLRSAQLAAAQGMTADVRTFMTALFQQKLKRGDRDGAIRLAQTRVSFDPSDIVGRLDAARMLAEAGDTAGAAGELRAAGLALEGQNRVPDAVRALKESLRFAPEDQETRSALVRLLVQQGDLGAATDLAQTREQLRDLVAECRTRGLGDAAFDALVRLGSLEPGPSVERAELARVCIERGDLDGAVAWAAVNGVIEMPELAIVLGETYLRQGRVDEGQTLLAEALSRDPGQLEAVARLVDVLQAVDLAAASAALLTVVDAELERGEASSANTRLGGFLAGAHDAHDTLAVLRRHIDVCVDGGFHEELPLAQLRLTDALIRRGEWHEARFIAEDLVASAPDDPRFADRLARIFDGLGLPVPDRGGGEFGLPDDREDGPAGLLDRAEPLSDQAEPGAMSDDFSDLVAALAQDHHDSPPDIVLLVTEPEPEPLPDPNPHPESAPLFDEPIRTASSRGSDLLMVNDDLRRLFEGGEVPPRVPDQDAAFEVDLSEALGSSGPTGEAVAAPAPPPAPAAEPETLDGFFKGLREQGDDRRLESERLLAQGGLERIAGRLDEAVAAFRAAARDPSARSLASRAIAGIAREQGNLAEAIEWLERATEVPAPTPEDAHVLLYELADALVAANEDARALAVFMELRASSGDFQDVEQRINELSERCSKWDSGPTGGAA